MLYATHSNFTCIVSAKLPFDRFHFLIGYESSCRSNLKEKGAFASHLVPNWTSCYRTGSVCDSHAFGDFSRCYTVDYIFGLYRSFHSPWRLKQLICSLFLINSSWNMITDEPISRAVLNGIRDHSLLQGASIIGNLDLKRNLVSLRLLGNFFVSCNFL